MKIEDLQKGMKVVPLRKIVPVIKNKYWGFDVSYSIEEYISKKKTEPARYLKEYGYLYFLRKDENIIVLGTEGAISGDYFDISHLVKYNETDKNGNYLLGF